MLNSLNVSSEIFSYPSFVGYSLLNNGKLRPLVPDFSEAVCKSFLNPSVIIDDGRIIVNIRAVNYLTYHSVGLKRFAHDARPIKYPVIDPDANFKTENFLCLLNDDLQIIAFSRCEMLRGETEPQGYYHGLEDARLVRWNDRLYLIGARLDRAAENDGERNFQNNNSRMEYSEIEIDSNGFYAKEVSNKRILVPSEVPGMWSLEKNWVPVMDRPHYFIKWHNPCEIVHVDPVTGKSRVAHLGNFREGLGLPRGGSQLVPWGEGYLSIVHDSNHHKSYLGHHDTFYLHRFIIWDSELNICHWSKPFSFMNIDIEFCAGLATNGDQVLITFGGGDSSSFVLQISQQALSEFLFTHRDWRSM